jgi:hypothetical protein|tara:strand:+ start:343 stop:525 length:183 start_codon:yes stop_codon:yes gene_type:complete
MSFFKKILSFFSPPQSNKEVVEEIKHLLKKDQVRARDGKGRYIPDDPDTEENEAWVEKAK